MPIIGSRDTWKNDTQASRRNRGPLLKVKHPDGHWTKMYEQDAIDAGLLKRKQAPAPANKLAPAPENKSAALPVLDDSPVTVGDVIEAIAAPVSDDFTTINGIGRATARLLFAQNVLTFEQLRTVDLESLSLSKTAVASIEAWRNG